jgi:hypothetical protein
MRKYLFLSILFISTLLCSQKIQACSGFYIAKDSIIYACKNTDLTDWKSKIWFTPASDTTFGFACFGFEYPYLSDGMNDKGLVVYHFSGHEKKITKSINKPVYNGVLSEYVLATCQSVEDVKILLNKYNLSLFHNGMIMYSDKYGNSIIVEGDTIIEKKHFYQVCMNTYQSERNEDTHPFWKQVASKQLIPQAESFTDSFCKDILQRMQDDMTQFSIIYDVNRLKFSVYLFHDFNYKVDFDLLIELKKGKRINDLYTFFPKESKYYQVYIQRQSPQNNVLVLLILIVCGLVFLYTIIVWPSARLFKNLEYNEKNEPKPKMDKSKLYSFLICILFSIYLILLINFKEAFQIGLPSRIDNFPFLIKLLIHIPLLLCILIVPLLIFNFKILRQPNWTKYNKWHFTINTISYLVLLGLFLYWGFVRIYI